MEHAGWNALVKAGPDKYLTTMLVACGAALVALASGSASALFLWALDAATATRLHYGWLIWLLPLAGWCVSWVYLKVGKEVEAGKVTLESRDKGQIGQMSKEELLEKLQAEIKEKK